jgi:two-component system invasion response regulator UvrY
MAKILVGDDHPVVRKGIKQILMEDKNISLVGEARSPNEVMEMVKKQHWDAVILDITMPGRGGLEVTKELKRGYPNLPILILSIHPEEQYGLRAIKAGAAGYMTKESAPEELVQALRRILGGGKYLSRNLAEMIAFGVHRNSTKPLHEFLSDREYQVMQMIATGQTVSDIADKLALSVKTVSTYRSRVIQKLKVKTTAEIVRYALENKLVT